MYILLSITNPEHREKIESIYLPLTSSSPFSFPFGSCSRFCSTFFNGGFGFGSRFCSTFFKSGFLKSGFGFNPVYKRINGSPFFKRMDLFVFDMDHCWKTNNINSRFHKIKRIQRLFFNIGNNYIQWLHIRTVWNFHPFRFSLFARWATVLSY